MNKAESILNDAKSQSDIDIMCEFWAVNVDFHEEKTEYFFSDGSSLISEC